MESCIDQPWNKVKRVGSADQTFAKAEDTMALARWLDQSAAHTVLMVGFPKITIEPESHI